MTHGTTDAPSQLQRRFGTDVDLENITSIARRTWQKYRLQNRGPNFYRIHGAVRYDLDEVLEWIKSNAARGHEGNVA